MLNPYNVCVGPLRESEGEVAERLMEEENERGSNQSDPAGRRAPAGVKGQTQTSPEKIDHQGDRLVTGASEARHTRVCAHTQTHKHIIILNPLIYLSTILNVYLYLLSFIFSLSLN